MVDPRARKGTGDRLGDASAAESNSHSGKTQATGLRRASPSYSGVVQIGEVPAAAVADCDCPRVTEADAGGAARHLTGAARDPVTGAGAAAGLADTPNAAARAGAQGDLLGAGRALAQLHPKDNDPYPSAYQHDPAALERHHQETQRLLHLLVVKFPPPPFLPPRETTPQPVIIKYDQGGLIYEHDARWFDVARKGVPVLVLGSCQSACTLVTAHVAKDKLCFGEAAS